MIYFIDEDDIQLRPFRLELALRDLESELIENADDALKQVERFTSSDYVFVDVMLAAWPNEEQSAFGREETDGYKTTGLVLVGRMLQAIADQKCALPTSHIVLMSQAASPTTRSKIDIFAKHHGLRFIPKSQFDDPCMFGEQVEAIVKA